MTDARANRGMGNSPKKFREGYKVIEAKSIYKKIFSSGMFWELFPELTGSWSDDKEAWIEILGKEKVL